jgi:hypothetical protein
MGERARARGSEAAMGSSTLQLFFTGVDECHVGKKGERPIQMKKISTTYEENIYMKNITSSYAN